MQSGSDCICLHFRNSVSFQDRSVSRFPSQKGHANEVSNHTAVISVISNSSRVPHYSTVISVASDSMTAPSLFDDLKDDLFTSVIATQRSVMVVCGSHVYNGLSGRLYVCLFLKHCPQTFCLTSLT